MATTEPKSGGLLDAVRRLGDAVLGLLHNRLQLFAVELQEEKYRFLQALLWLTGGLVLLALGLTLAVGAVAVLVHRAWGVAGLAVLAVVFLLAGAGTLAVMWNRFKSSGMPFSSTVEELKKDSQWLRGKH
jgi:uncharacterized membrane protein YqjE